MSEKRKHATVSSSEGVNYRDMAAVMTVLGFPMFHSSARNNVIRVMYRFAEALSDFYNLSMTDEELMNRAKSPEFQEIIGEILNHNNDMRSIADS